ncbi:MAG: phosphatase PAP2 family protein [Hespellia sp.]|nr:phosphatase PAP2 family protein [Hespellia sp.]
MIYLQQLDGTVLLWIQDHLRFSILDGFWRFITSLGNAGALWIALGIGLLCMKKTRSIGLTMLCALVLNILMTNVVLKHLVARPRPFTELEAIIPLIKRPMDYSFPSGHTAASFAAAFVAYRMLPKKYGISLMVIAGQIAFSRLYLGVHYPSDVLGGIIVGCFAAVISVKLIKSLENRYTMFKTLP